MKRSQLILLIFILSFLSLPLAAQSFIEIRAGLNLGLPTEYHTIDEDLHELKDFKRKTDRFIFLAERGKWREANRVKSSLLRDMRREIHQSKDLLQYSSDRKPRGHAYGLYKKKGRSKFNKRKGHDHASKGYQSYQYELLQLQKSLYRDLQELSLGYGRVSWNGVKLHAQILYDFEYTMEDQLYAYNTNDRRRRIYRDH